MSILIRGLVCIGLCFSATGSAQAPSCANGKGALVDSKRPAGQADKKNPIEHIVILMQENHSFDNYFGRLNQPKYYGANVDGILETMTNPTANGEKVSAYHETNHCVSDPEHGWNAIHQEWNGGANDGFVILNDKKAMGFFDETDIPYYYDLANKFAIGDRYYCSALTQTFPNRFFLYSATSFGHIANDMPEEKVGFAQPTIFDTLNTFKVSWKYYHNDFGYLGLFQPLYLANPDKMAPIDQFQKDLQAGTLPAVSMIDSDWGGEDEHPSSNIQVGQKFVADRVQELANSSAWKNSVMFLMYDEGGGFFDHAAPPEACVPDAIGPMLEPGSAPGRFDRYGLRVPFVAVSPYVKHHYVSHETFDHTSILKFIETKFNLPALTTRDANANNLMDLFDFANPQPQIKPDAGLAKVQVDPNCDEPKSKPPLILKH
jgi:phospholipase C